MGSRHSVYPEFAVIKRIFPKFHSKSLCRDKKRSVHTFPSNSLGEKKLSWYIYRYRLDVTDSFPNGIVRARVSERFTNTICARLSRNVSTRAYRMIDKKETSAIIRRTPRRYTRSVIFAWRPTKSTEKR